MKEMSLDFSTLNRDTQSIYRAHDVKGYGRQARIQLSQKLNHPLPPTPTDTLRQQITALREQGLTYPQIAKKLNRPFSAIEYHVKHFRKQQHESQPAAPPP